MTTIELHNVTKNGDKNQRRLLDGISLTVPDGTSLAIVGTPGAGTSELLRLIVGLDYPDDGEILMDGSLINLVEPRDRDVAMVFQDFEIYPHLDVFENIAFSASLRKGNDRDVLSQRIDDVAMMLGLAAKLDLKPRQLSTVDRQLVALARVLVRDASVYLFDDAFSALDARQRSQMRSVVGQWQRSLGRTSIFVTTDIAEALSLGDQVAVMHQGFVHQTGAPRDLYERPSDLFVAAFLGDPAINLLPAMAHDSVLQLPFVTLPFGEEMMIRAAGRELLMIGIRPEDCLDASTLSADQLQGKVVFSAKIDEVEWRGRSQYAYLGFEIDDETEIVLEEVENHLEYDLFQTFLLAEVAAERELATGMFLKIAVDSQRIHVFDPATGENLTLPSQS